MRARKTKRAARVTGDASSGEPVGRLRQLYAKSQSGAVAGAVAPLAVVVAAAESAVEKAIPDVCIAKPPLFPAAMGTDSAGVVEPSVTDPEAALKIWM